MAIVSLDQLYACILQELCGAVLRVMERQLGTQLPGGEFCDPSPTLLQQAASCPPTNLATERAFAIADQEMYRAWNATPGHVESKVMFRVNKTGQWLADPGSEEKEARCRLARKQVRLISTQEKQRKKLMEQKIDNQIKKSRQDLARKEDKMRDQQERWFSNVYQNGGLWTSGEEINSALQGLSKTKATAAVKAQINVRTKVLQLNDGTVLMKNNLNALKERLQKLINAPVSGELLDLYECISNPLSMLGNSFRQRWKSDSGLVNWHSGAIVDRVNDEFKLQFDDDFFSSQQLNS